MSLNMEEEDYSKISIEDRCNHKVWKARLSGYESAADLFKKIDDENSSEWNKYVNLVKRFVYDTNAPAQEKGLEAVLVFVEKSSLAKKSAGDILFGLVQKCISSSRARTKELALQIALMYIEIEQQDVFIEELMKGTESKSPRIVSSSVRVINSALSSYGPKIINLSKVVKQIPKLFEVRDNTVRIEAKLLLIEMFRWLGPGIKLQMTCLKPVQITEMETEFEKISGNKPKPTRFIRSQINNPSLIDENEKVYEPPQEIDPYDLLDPVDILNKLPKEFYNQLESNKWLERKEALESLEHVLNSSPKIENAEYGDLMRALNRIISKDSNIVVVGLAIKCVTNLAYSLRKNFHPYAPVIMTSFLEKFKEKKPNIVVALREGVDAIFPSTSLEVLFEDLIVCLDNKNPNIKAETASFLARCFSKCPSAVTNKKLMKPFTKSLLKCLGDQDPAVRDNAAQAIGTAMKAGAEKIIGPFLVDIDNQKSTKIKECFDKAEIFVEPYKMPNLKDNKKVSKIIKPVKTRRNINSVPKQESEEISLSHQEYVEKARSMLDTSIISSLSATDSNERLIAYNKFLQNIKDFKANEETGQALLHVLHAAHIDENEPEICKLKLQSFKYIADTMPLSSSISSFALPETAELILKPNCKEYTIQTLWSFTNALSLDVVAQNLLENENIFSDSKIWIETLNWFSSAIMKDGVKNTNFIVKCGKKALNHNDPLVKNAGLALIGTIYLQGANNLDENVPIKFEDTKFFKNGITKGKTRKISKCDDEIVKPDKKISTEISRVDISPQITEELINELSNKNWKVRAEAVNKIQIMIKSAENIMPDLGDSPFAIAGRISDSNPKISVAAISLVESLAQSMGPPCKKYLRIFLPPLIKIMGDSKPWIRTAALPCISTWGETVGYREFFDGEMIADALKTGSPALRAELWLWIRDKLNNIPVKKIQKDELLACLPTLYANTEDRNADVRKNACEAVPGFMKHLGFNNMLSACENIKGSSGLQIKQLLEKTRGLLHEMSPPKPSPEKNTAKPIIGKLAPGSTKTVAKSTKSKVSSVVKSVQKKEESDSLLQANNLKHQRIIDEQKHKSLKWNFVTPRSEFITLLKDQMHLANVNETLIENMFNTDFKYHLRAVDALNEDLDNRFGLISNLDLILRWMTIRFFDTNPSVLLKSLEYLNNVFNILIEEEYTLFDIEASSFLPYLILKIGDPKDSVRNSVRALLKLTGSVYPPSKQFSFIMEGVKCKNSRQKAECLEQLSWLIDKYGITVCQPTATAALKEIAKHISDRDASVRNAALNSVITSYSHEGEKVLKMLSHISEKDFSLLEDRVKRACKNKPVEIVKPLSQPSSSSTPQGEINEYEEPPEHHKTPPEYHNKPVKITSKNTHQYCLDQDLIDETDRAFETIELPELEKYELNFGIAKVNKKSIPVPDTSLNFSKPTAIKWELSQIVSCDFDKSMASIMHVDSILKSENKNDLVGFVDYMVLQLIHHLITLNQSEHSEVANGYKANFSLLMKLSQYKNLCREIQEDTLYKIINQLLILLTERAPGTEENLDLFARAINSLVLNILNNSNQTNAMCALLKLLYDSIHNHEDQYKELIIKCIWKINKTQYNYDELDYERIFIEMHNFFKHFPLAWWKTQEDKPLRIVQTVLNTMVKIRGSEVKKILNTTSIPTDSELVRYVKKLISRFDTKVEELPETINII